AFKFVRRPLMQNLQYLGLNSSLQSRQQNFFDMLSLGNFAHNLNCAHSLKMFFLFFATQYIVTSSEFRHEFIRGWLYGIFIFISITCLHDQGSIGTCLVIWIHEPIIIMWQSLPFLAFNAMNL
ncbi:hypothetical protein ACJX0J_009527, partial [Zea mays]